jgi:hypothetical protein
MHYVILYALIAVYFYTRIQYEFAKYDEQYLVFELKNHYLSVLDNH